MLKFLAGLNLLLSALVLAGFLASRAMDYGDAAVNWRAARAAEFTLEVCEKKHETLLRQIKKEGLWKRLGLPAQPWLW